MSLRSRLRAPVAAALAGALVAGLLAYPAASPSRADGGGRAGATDPSPSARTSATKDGLTQSRAVFPRASYLCYGYKDCTAKGYSAAGYPAANKNMYWRMYAGHNCTNYAAYRMVKSGMPNTRPWSGGGNATYWGTKMSRITDSTPAVGAVAWWKANVGPAGSAGHVAYVERVVSSTQIVVSQDSWGGDFSWATITKASGKWPSGFIHFNDRTMANTVAPTISGDVKVGSPLQASSGTWTPSGATLAYQWYAGTAAIAGATAATFTPTAAQLGQAIKVRVTASLAGYASKAVVSKPTAAVLPGELKATTQPRVTGVVQVGKALAVNRGAWNVAPSSYAQQWFASGVAIPGATGATLAVTPDLVGRALRVAVTAARPGYKAVRKYTPLSAPVAPGTMTTVRAPRIAGQPRVGAVLTADPGSYAPGDAATSIQWTRDGVAIPGATGATYLLTRHDLGARIRSLVVVRRAGYTDTTLSSGPTFPVRGVPVIRLARIRHRHHVVLRVFIGSGGLVRPVTGRVVVRLSGGFRQELELRNGRARVVLRDGQLKRGVHALRVRYAGTSALIAAVREGRLRTY